MARNAVCVPSLARYTFALYGLKCATFKSRVNICAYLGQLPANQTLPAADAKRRVTFLAPCREIKLGWLLLTTWTPDLRTAPGLALCTAPLPANGLARSRARLRAIANGLCLHGCLLIKRRLRTPAMNDLLHQWKVSRPFIETSI